LKARGIFNAGEVARLWHEHRRGGADHCHRLWQLIMLELWFRRFVDQGGNAVASTEPLERDAAFAAPMAGTGI
jgi:hypothetical protein